MAEEANLFTKKIRVPGVKKTIRFRADLIDEDEIQLQHVFINDDPVLGAAVGPPAEQVGQAQPQGVDKLVPEVAEEVHEDKDIYNDEQLGEEVQNEEQQGEAQQEQENPDHAAEENLNEMANVNQGAGNAGAPAAVVPVIAGQPTPVVILPRYINRNNLTIEEELRAPLRMNPVNREKWLAKVYDSSFRHWGEIVKRHLVLKKASHSTVDTFVFAGMLEILEHRSQFTATQAEIQQFVQNNAAVIDPRFIGKVERALSSISAASAVCSVRGLTDSTLSANGSLVGTIECQSVFMDVFLDQAEFIARKWTNFSSQCLMFRRMNGLNRELYYASSLEIGWSELLSRYAVSSSLTATNNRAAEVSLQVPVKLISDIDAGGIDPNVTLFTGTVGFVPDAQGFAEELAEELNCRPSSLDQAFTDVLPNADSLTNSLYPAKTRGDVLAVFGAGVNFALHNTKAVGVILRERQNELSGFCANVQALAKKRYSALNTMRIGAVFQRGTELQAASAAIEDVYIGHGAFVHRLVDIEVVDPDYRDEKGQEHPLARAHSMVRCCDDMGRIIYDVVTPKKEDCSLNIEVAVNGEVKSLADLGVTTVYQLSRAFTDADKKEVNDWGPENLRNSILSQARVMHPQFKVLKSIKLG